MVSPKAQNISQMIFFSTSYVVLNGDIVILLNHHLKLHTGWKKKNNSFVTQKSFSIDMVKEQEISKDNAKVKTKWNAILRTSSLDPLWRTRAIELELNPARSSPGMAQGCWTSEAIWGLRRLWGQGPRKRVRHPAYGKQLHAGCQRVLRGLLGFPCEESLQPGIQPGKFINIE